MPSFSLTVNGKQRRVDAPSDEPLLVVLRDRLDLTGTKYGWGEGQCGACMVLLDWKASKLPRRPQEIPTPPERGRGPG